MMCGSDKRAGSVVRATHRLVKTPLRTVVALVAIASTPFLIAGTTALAQQTTPSQPSLRFSDAEKVLVVELEPDFFWVDRSRSQEVAETSVTIINTSDEPLNGLEFIPEDVRNQDGITQKDVVTVKAIEKDTSINRSGSKTFELDILVKNPPEELTGQLLVKAKDGAKILPGRRSFTISEPPAPLSSNKWWFDGVVITSIILALVFIAACLIKREVHLRQRSTKPIDWDPKGSWAATLSTAGGVIGVVLATQVLPKDTKLLSNIEFAALTVFFSVCIFFGAFFFNSTRRKTGRTIEEDGKKTPEQEWYVRNYLFAMLINMWGVFGQLAIAFLVLNELKVQGGITDVATSILLTLFAFSAILSIRYAWKRTKEDLTAQHRAEEAQERAG